MCTCGYTPFLDRSFTPESFNTSTHYLEHQALGLTSSSVHPDFCPRSLPCSAFLAGTTHSVSEEVFPNFCLRSLPCSVSHWHSSLCLRGGFSQLLSQKSSVLSVSLALLTLPQRSCWGFSKASLRTLSFFPHTSPLTQCLTDADVSVQPSPLASVLHMTHLQGVTAWLCRFL